MQRKEEVAKTLNSNWTNITAVDPRTFTDCMEQLQEAYVTAVAATAGCSVEIVRRDMHGFDLIILRDSRSGGDEASLWVQLKSTTTVLGADQQWFSFKFRQRDSFDRLAKLRSAPKAILVVMITSPVQADWTWGDHDHLRVRHCSYWINLEGQSAAPGVQSPTVRLSTANIFDAPALSWMMDKLERGDPI